MAEWWDTTRNKFESGTASSSSSSTTTSSELMGSFAWPTDMTDIKPRSCSSFDSELVTGASGIFQDTQKLQGPNTDPNLHMMGLGLSSHSQDWNQTLLREEKAETGFLSIIPENANFQQDHAGMVQWREKLFGDDSTDSSVHEVKQMNRGFSLDQSQFVSHCSSSDTTSSASFHVDHSSYGSLPAMSCQGLLGYENQSQQQQRPSFDNKSTMNFPYPLANYTMNPSEILPSHWSTRPIPQFLRNSPPKQQSQFHFSTTPFWNPTSASMNNVRPSFLPPLPGHFSAQTFEEKPKNILDIRDSISVGKKSGSNQPAASKRPRNETSSPLPALKVRKEKMGDRITALQQLVSPFGKTDTASVLSEAIEYIKFLHEQVGVLSTPYLKSGAPIQPQQNPVNSKDQDGPKQDLRSRGLCLVPVSSTFPVTHETTVNFWTPSFGGSYR